MPLLLSPSSSMLFLFQGPYLDVPLVRHPNCLLGLGQGRNGPRHVRRVVVNQALDKVMQAVLQHRVLGQQRGSSTFMEQYLLYWLRSTDCARHLFSVLRSRNYLFSAPTLAPPLSLISALAPAPAQAIHCHLKLFYHRNTITMGVEIGFSSS